MVESDGISKPINGEPGSGEAAQADCKGTASWQPKVGGGPQTAARQWRFDLRNAGGDWVITRATVR